MKLSNLQSKKMFFEKDDGTKGVLTHRTVYVRLPRPILECVRMKIYTKGKLFSITLLPRGSREYPTKSTYRLDYLGLCKLLAYSMSLEEIKKVTSTLLG